MSVIIFELKKEHLLLLKHLKWSLTDNNFIISSEEGDENPKPFNEDNIYNAIDLILNGRDQYFDILVDEPKEYSSEEKQYMDELYNSLPIALEIILYNGNFGLGWYKAKWHDRQWKKTNPKLIS